MIHNCKDNLVWLPGGSGKKVTKNKDNLLAYCSECGNRFMIYFEIHKTLSLDKQIKSNPYIKKSLQQAKEEGYEAGLKKKVIGISQWKALGKKYGYWDFFKKEAREEILKEVRDEIGKSFERR